MSISAISQEAAPTSQVKGKELHEAEKPQKAHESNFHYSTETYQVSKDGDSFEMSYSKTTIDSTISKGNQLDPRAAQLLNGFNIDDFQEKIKSDLLEMVFESNKKAQEETNESLLAKYGSDVIYEVSEDVEAAEVPEFWNAENTAQRLVDFAMSFKGVAGIEDDVEYITEIRDAVEEGFRQAKGIIGTVDDSTHRLYNDTFELTMKKFDDLLAEASGPTQIPQPVDMVA
ncbi:MAG: hypothetical protein OCC49_13165 [Fibrobacterales bacterium]